MASGKKSVLFICLGNICRSPIAEAVFRTEVEKRGLQDQWEIDSAAIGTWHIGRRPDKRGLACLSSKGIKTEHLGRQIEKDDFRKFDFIFGMDDENMEDLNSIKPKDATAQLKLLGEYDPKKIRIIEDPYYGSDDNDFETVYEQCTRACKAFLDSQS